MTSSKFMLTSLCLSLSLMPFASARAQLGGSRTGASATHSQGAGVGALAPLSPEVAKGYIMIEGRSELRVQPTEIRIVLAVTAEGDTPSACQQAVAEKVKALVAAWTARGIAQADIVEDFISVLPRFDFEILRTAGREVAKEKKVGFLMQTNLHVAVDSDEQAMRVIRLAFEHDVADVIAFDYWSRNLDDMKIKARAGAIEAARAKADVLMQAFFETRPPVINVQEATKVQYPEALYASFSNSSDAAYHTNYARGSMPEIRMFRPRNTYYRGLYPNADVQAKTLPMRPEISIVSTVQLYFESPAVERNSMLGTGHR